MRQIHYIIQVAEIHHIALPQFVSHSVNEMKSLLDFEIWKNERVKAAACSGSADDLGLQVTRKFEEDIGVA
ncbi:hypothetical protein [Paenibacillus amylolyticus]|uniref:hypothetical protein n=1 Tax=Paenibacillus amylolyticus TaxID=1451 RepID=UPI00344EA540